MANLLINTTVGGNAVITTSNIGSYALTSIPATISPTNVNIGNAIYFGAGNNYLNWDGARINSNVGIQSTSNMRAPIFYDSADTAYYLDPNSTSYLYHLILSGNSYFRPQSWIQFDGNYGIYWPNNYGLHIYPNAGGSYGALQINGVKNGWAGIYFNDSGNTIMANSNESGFHRQGSGWQFRWTEGTMYVHRSTNGGGTAYTVVDSGNVGNYTSGNSNQLGGYSLDTMKKYIWSRGENLLTNGTGLMGNNTNFGSFIFDGSQAYFSSGSFKYTGQYQAPNTDELMPMNPEKRYRLDFWAKTLNGQGAYYAYLNFFDVDGQAIVAPHHMYYANTLTTLAQTLNPGDTVVYLNSVANWENGGTAGVSTHIRSFIFWNYTNSFGYTYPPQTYSRNWYPDSWNPGAINSGNNTITLRVPWSGPTIAAGTQVSNGSAGGTYKYIALGYTIVPTTWTNYVGIMDGVDYSGSNAGGKFPPGTASAKLGFLTDYNASGDTIYLANLFVGVDNDYPIYDRWTGNTRIEKSGAFYGTMFYDSNNGSYYLDPSSTSRLGTLNINQLSVYGNTYLGDGNGDEVHINDVLRLGATDSGDAHFFFGEGGSAGSDYGSHWYWDSGYTFTWNTRNAGTDTALFNYVTNDTTYVNWSRNFNMQNREVNYVSQLHFNGGTRFVNYNSNYLYFQPDSTSVGGIIVRDGNVSIRGYSAYFDGSGFGLLNSTGNWGIRLNPGNVGTDLFYAGGIKLATLSEGTRIYGNLHLDDNYGYGIVGVYSSSRYQGVWAMGNSYKLSADGTSTGNLYGLAWSHPDAGGQTKAGLEHQLLVMNYGVTQTAIGTGIWTAGLITTTSYGTSANWNTAYGWGNHASAGYLTSLPSHNHDDRYYTESESDGRYAYKAGAAGQDFSADKLSSYYLRNHYGVSTDHSYGMYFDNNLSTAYAIYRESGSWDHPYPDLRIAFHTGIKLGANSGYQGIKFYTDYDMVTQVMSVNNGSDPLGAGNVYVNNSLQAGSSLRAPIFYDSQDTNYYVDPNSNSYLSTLRVANASNGVSLHVGNGSTHGVYTADNDRKYLVVSALYYPHMALVASNSNNSNHGAVFSFVGSESGAARQWNLGISNTDPFLFSIGYNRSGDNNPHYGIGDGWHGDDNHHARLSIDRSGNTKIRGMLYVNGTSGSISTGSAVIHAGNIGSQSVSYASTAGSASSSPYLSALGDYVFSASTNGRDFSRGIQTSFVSTSQGYPEYGSVVRIRTYTGSNDGGTAELYFPYSSTYGGTSMRYRLGQYSNAGWTGWKTVIDSDNISSQSVSYATTAGALSSMNISQFSNNSGYLTGITSGQVTGALGYTPYNSSNPNGYVTSSGSVNYATTAGSAPNGSNVNSNYDVAVGDGNGLRFWGGSDSYKISMGVGALYQYGPVTDYSIKAQMNDSSTARGFTWGRISYAPIAALNSTSGDMEIAGYMKSYGYRGNGNVGGTGTASWHPDGIYCGSTMWQYGTMYKNGSSIYDVGELKMNGGPYLQTYNDRNLIVKGSSSSDAGIEGRNSAGSNVFQIYGAGSDYGFLNGTWGGWDIRKTKNSAMYMNNNDSYYLHTNSTSNFVALNIQGNAVVHAGNIGSQSVSYAATAGSAGSVSGLTLTSSANGINPDSVTQNQIGYNTSVSLFGQTDGGLYSSAFSSAWIHQIYGDFRTGQIAIRGKNSGSWQSWRTVLDSGNYTSYSPSLTGSGASGTWGINVTGSAGSVAWTNVSSRPTSLSQFSNDLGNYGGFLTSLGFSYSTGVTGNHVVQRDANGYIYANHINFNTSETENPTINSFITSNGDGWSRKSSIAHVRNQLGNYGGWLTTSGKAADSELIDGIDSSRIIYGDGSFGSTNYSDMNNTAQKSGFFFYNQPTGNPFGDWTHWINCMGNSWNPNYGFQLAHAFHSNNFAVRVVANGGFSSWRTIIDSGNIGSQSVNYASSAGSAGSATNAGQLNTYGYLVGENWDTYYTSGKLRVASASGATGVGRPPSSVHNYGSLLSYGISGEDMFQMYFPDNAGNSIANSRKLHYRTGRGAWCDWRTVVDMVGDTLTIVEGGTPKIVVRGSVPYGQATSASIELVGDADGGQTQSYRWISNAPDWSGQELRLERKVNNSFQLVGRVPKNTNNLEWQGTIVQGLSDSRVKTNVVSMTEGLDKIDQIRPVTFDWVPTENVSDREGADFGFIAQELEEVLPEVVHTRGDGYKTVMYEKVVPVLVQAMKEQQALIEALRAEVELLKNK